MEFRDVYAALGEIVQMKAEERAMVAMYVCMMQARPANPLQLWITGDYGSGKTILARVVRQLLPALYEVEDGGYPVIATTIGQERSIPAVMVKYAKGLKRWLFGVIQSGENGIRVIGDVLVVRMPDKCDARYLRTWTDEQIVEVLQKHGCLAA